jgi:hypothetical protein
MKINDYTLDYAYERFSGRYNDPQDPLTFEERKMFGIILNVDVPILRGEAKHLFMPNKEFCDWLVSCVNKLQPEHARMLIENMGCEVGVLHFPTDSKITSVGFWIPQEIIWKEKAENGYYDLRDVECLPDGTFRTRFDQMYISISRDFPSKVCVASMILRDLPPNDEFKGSEYFMWYTKLIVGLGMYVSCFPETITEGVPEDLKHPSYHPYAKPFVIGVSNKIRGVGTGDSVNPHYRKGHWRLLQSEKFTHKRYQSIFVSECFIHGEADTILSPEQVSA